MAVFRKMLDADLHESVAREHVDRGMPVVELHRNHGVPLASVRRWIETYRAGGGDAVRTAAKELTARYRKPLAPAALAKLRSTLADPARDERSLTARREAVVAVAVRDLRALADDVEALVRRREEVIEGLLTLGDLGELERIDRLAPVVGQSYRGWIEGARERARAVASRG